jgi:hypothetical protein
VGSDKPAMARITGMPFMTDTWRFIIVVSLLVVVGSLLPFAAGAASSVPSPVLHEGDARG